MTYAIEKNVPLPKPKGRTLYPFADMVEGDSFHIACSPEDQERVHRRVLKAAEYYGRKAGARFTGRKDADGVRFWRIQNRRY